MKSKNWKKIGEIAPSNSGCMVMISAGEISEPGWLEICRTQVWVNKKAKVEAVMDMDICREIRIKFL